MKYLSLLMLFFLSVISGCGSSDGGSISPQPITPNPQPEPLPEPEPSRSQASYQYLQADADQTFSSSAYLPINAITASNIFEGTLTITGQPSFELNYGDSSELPDGFNDWPDFNYEFIQDNGRLIPVDRGHGFIGNGAWSIHAGVGAVWDEIEDNGYSRAAFPYTIKENNQNCEANGLATFLFKSDGTISKVQVQNVAETCRFYGFEFYGTLDASYDSHTIAAKAEVINARNIEEAARIPTKALSELATDFPGVNLANYAYNIPAAQLNGFSVLVNGTNYIDGCTTRYGEHPYCMEKTIGLYSFTKTIHAFLLVAALEKQYPGFKNTTIKSLVPECVDSRWDNVTVEQALDMATGNYQSSLFQVDEGSEAIVENYFIATSREERADFACNGWPQQVTPGTYSVYHTSDTELVGYAANTFVKSKLGNEKEAFNDVLIPLYQTIGLSDYIKGTQRTSDTMEAWAGYGLSAPLNDVVRVLQYIRDEGISGGLLDPTMVNEVLSGEVRGLPANADFLNYDNGFWRLHVGAFTDMSACGPLTQVPMLSGFGGHTSVILPDVIITQMTDSGAIGMGLTISDVFNNISNKCP
ncbi:hypothetical protein AADZ84_07345 [Colwelliaceae bacterium MEBiC 14330]